MKRLLNDSKKARHALVATDIASRGIDVDHLSLVVNFELPNLSESYVHRIDVLVELKEGMAVSFCNEGSERHYLVEIQKLIEAKSK